MGPTIPVQLCAMHATPCNSASDRLFFLSNRLENCSVHAGGISLFCFVSTTVRFTEVSVFRLSEKWKDFFYFLRKPLIRSMLKTKAPTIDSVEKKETYEPVTRVGFQLVKHHLTCELLPIYFREPQTGLVFRWRDIMF